MCKTEVALWENCRGMNHICGRFPDLCSARTGFMRQRHLFFHLLKVSSTYVESTDVESTPSTPLMWEATAQRAIELTPGTPASQLGSSVRFFWPTDSHATVPEATSGTSGTVRVHACARTHLRATHSHATHPHPITSNHSPPTPRPATHKMLNPPPHLRLDWS